MARYGTTSNLTHADTKAKIKQTNLDRYGVEHAMKRSASVQKLRDSKLLKYGDPAFNNREKFKDTRSTWSNEKIQGIHTKRTTTNTDRYGVDYTFQSGSVQHKIRETNVKRYGVENPAKSLVIKEKIKQTMIATYGSHFNQRHIDSGILDSLADEEFLQKNKDRALQDLATDLGVTTDVINYAYGRSGITRTFAPSNVSLGETQVAGFISSLGVRVETNCRKLLDNGKELDIYLPESGLAIEYDGLYWHSEGNKPDKRYHIDKTIAAKDKNISLLHITDYEWENKQDIVKSRISTKLGFATKIFARKCEVREVTATQTTAFLNRTHIQGSVASKIRLGLFNGDSLVSIMTFSKARFNGKVQWELVRNSSELGTVVVGGAGKLMAAFIKAYDPESIISYCDLRWNSGAVYSKLGFIQERINAPNYWYTYRYSTFESRIQYQKHKLHTRLTSFDPIKSEWENMRANGYDRFWDCGNAVFLWNREKTG